MPAAHIETSSHESQWAEQVFTCLQEFAARRTNAVLLTLADVDRLESERRYPESGLTFADNRWRAFYHCHEADSQHPDEHGHFHIFTDIGKQTWAHVAGLGIDASGQPLQWFAVNRWVTDGPWLERAEFLHQLDTTSDSKDDPLTGRWLFALLQLYRSNLSDLLAQRDAQILVHEKNQDRAATLEDSSIYTLAAQPVELQSMLENHLLY
jgi:hypothetical protein